MLPIQFRHLKVFSTVIRQQVCFLAGTPEISGVLLADVIGHPLVEPQLLPLGVEVRLVAVAADEAVQTGSDVRSVQLLA